MAIHTHPILIGQHALAVLASAIVSATIFSLIWATLLIVATKGALPGLAWLMMATALCWLAVFIVVLPAMGIVLTLLLPVTRRGTGSASAVCLVAGATVGTMLAPLGSRGWHGATPLQLLISATTGLAATAIYLAIALHSSSNPPRSAATIDG